MSGLRHLLLALYSAELDLPDRAKESTKEGTNKSAIAINSRRKGGRWRNGSLVRSRILLSR